MQKFRNAGPSVDNTKQKTQLLNSEDSVQAKSRIKYLYPPTSPILFFKARFVIPK